MWTLGNTRLHWRWDGWRPAEGCSSRPVLGHEVTGSKHACRGRRLTPMWLLWHAGCRGRTGRWGTPPHVSGEVGRFWGRGLWRRPGRVREVTSPHILVSAAPFWCSPEESWEQSVSWLALPAPFPPCSSLGQKGRHWMREDVQDLVPIPQGRL